MIKRNWVKMPKIIHSRILEHPTDAELVIARDTARLLAARPAASARK